MVVLFDQSKTLVEEFTLIPNTQKCLLFSDPSGLKKIQPFIESLDAQGVSYEFYYLTKEVQKIAEIELLESLPKGTRVLYEFSDECILRIAGKQKLGTQLYLAGSWKALESLYPLAVHSGFGQEDVQVYWEKRERVESGV
ncbi:hypothetical protein [Ammoniphilus sp. YIM 78166]|uniref:hypothetical protein n=1 Tax=Ammoniphilus sp. YIM 78166 TaxID=1644106 RepID=UPI00106F6E17|nr:hypothetical protein [Ammoniphilus sp. YIM 78166]